MTINRISKRAALLATVAVMAVSANGAFAQDADEDEAAAAPATNDVITVTGSRLRRDEFSSAAPIQVINSETATLEGLVDSADILQGASVAAGSVQYNNRFGGFVIEGGTGTRPLSLRGLGGQRTLVLLNGRRPGPSGTRGQVGAFDLSVVPESIVNRYEILKDGASSIYGSDAVAGVVNLITRTSIDEPEINMSISKPFESGAEVYTMSGAYGLNFDTGNIVLAAEYQFQEPLREGDREYLRCGDHLVTDGQGNNIDWEDRSIIGNDCDNLYHNTIIDALFGDRYIPAPDGVTVGPLEGYRPRANGRYDDFPGAPAFFEDVSYFPNAEQDYVLNENERYSLYGASDFEFDILGGIGWQVEAMFSSRETDNKYIRQFAPYIGGFNPYTGGTYVYPNDPGFYNVFESVVRPIYPFPGHRNVKVDYTLLSSQLDGEFGFGGFLEDWGWQASGVYTKAEGEYTDLSLISSLSGDILESDSAPTYDPFDTRLLSGSYLTTDRAYGDQFINSVSRYTTGTTEYEQLVLTGVVTGDVFSLPAGEVAVAIGAEYRDFSLNDQPSEESLNSDIYASSSGLVTKGSDSVKEAFAEIEVPILAGTYWAEELTLNASGRIFDYDSYGSDEVYKVGANWQINPTVRLRATHGTSYRAPALYELYLGDTTGFQAQGNIDPCIFYEDSTNANLRANCAAAGIPLNYSGGTETALIITSGGLGVLEAETSKASTFGLVLTPSFDNINIAIDYFKIEVNDQVARLGAGGILGGCYGAVNFPNAFCDLFDRNNGGLSGTDFAITEVRDSYLNINNQVNEGFDLTVRYEREFDFGSFLFEGQGTYTITDQQDLFDPNLESGFDTNDFNGSIGDPKFVANTRFAFEREDWTFSWFIDYIGKGDNDIFYAEESTYFGRPAVYDVKASDVYYHSASVRWEGDTLTVIAGIDNVFDRQPPTVSTGGDFARLGTVPVSGTQYDLVGRTAFLTLSKTF